VERTADSEEDSFTYVLRRLQMYQLALLEGYGEENRAMSKYGKVLGVEVG